LCAARFDQFKEEGMRKKRCGAMIALAVLSAGTFDEALSADYIYLRETGNSNPMGRGIYQSGMSAQGGGAFLPFIFTNTTSQVLQLDHGQMGVSAYTMSGLLTDGLYANAWSEAEFYGGNPLANGDLVERVGVPPPSTHEAVGSTSLFGAAVTNYIAAWNTPGSLLYLNLILDPGETAYFGVACDNQSVDGSGVWMPRESNLMMSSDMLWASSLGYELFSEIPWTQHAGYLEGDWAFVVVPEPASILVMVAAVALVTRRRIP
jgi:hypothetical protein